MALLALLTAIAISIVAAYFSIYGLTAIFLGAFIPVLIMGSVLELGKIVTASLLYWNWERFPTLIKTALVSMVTALVLITSIGIFGFLSRAHIEHSVTTGDSSALVQLCESRLETEHRTIRDAERVLAQLDQSVEVLLNANRISGPSGGVALRQTQRPERDNLTSIITDSNINISNIMLECSVLQSEQRAIEAKVGPIKYVAELVYGESSEEVLQKSVRFLIIILVLVFDPLAILLLIAANMAIKNKGLRGVMSLQDLQKLRNFKKR